MSETVLACGSRGFKTRTVSGSVTSAQPHPTFTTKEKQKPYPGSAGNLMSPLGPLRNKAFACSHCVSSALRTKPLKQTGEYSSSGHPFQRSKNMAGKARRPGLRSGEQGEDAGHEARTMQAHGMAAIREMESPVKPDECLIRRQNVISCKIIVAFVSRIAYNPIMPKKTTCQRCAGTGVEPDPTATGIEMRKLRNKSGKSLRYVADKMGISAPYLSDLELGRRGWSLEKILSFKKIVE